ncbi:hypothetical protein KBD33_00775 [Candidatus Gracilibacteria bacterium]|nr:hypothetical protein [Candidatus Gracilibacteria bacterium]
MIKSDKLKTQYGQLEIVDKRKYISNFLEEFLDKGENFVIIYRFINDYPNEANENFLDEIFEAIIQTLDEITEQSINDSHQNITEIVKKIQDLEKQERLDFNGTEILSKIY